MAGDRAQIQKLSSRSHGLRMKANEKYDCHTSQPIRSITCAAEAWFGGSVESPPHEVEVVVGSGAFRTRAPVRVLVARAGTPEGVSPRLAAAANLLLHSGEPSKWEAFGGKCRCAVESFEGGASADDLLRGVGEKLDELL